MPPTVSATTFPVTLVVLTYNEAGQIARCLDSVPWAAEKLVVDCGSTDQTVAIAQAHGARVLHQSWLGFGAQRRFATAQATYPWQLVLDADEWLSPELAREIAQRLPELQSSSLAGAFLLRSAWFMGARMRWYRPLARERIERLFHRERAEWSTAPVHEALRFKTTALTLRAPLLHAYTPTLLQRVVKDAYYAELRVREWQHRGRRARLWLCPLIYVATFLKDYLLRLAILDGGRGYVAAHLAATYSVYKRLRLYEVNVFPPSVELAQQALRRYGIERGE